ncbi:MAG: DUF2254 domain-containing protein [Candidatus Krumholzibacteriales bacterium]
MIERIKFLINRIRERLWVKPLAMSLLSIAAALVARIADSTNLGLVVPVVSTDSIDTLLSIMAASMLTIAIFAVGAMVAAYSSASNTASPRSFTLIIADDISQRALSTFIGAFIFSIVGLVASKNEFFERAGSFVLFLFTLAMFGIVVVRFVRWVDRIARLGRLGNTIHKVEEATAEAMKRYRDAPAVKCLPAGSVRSPDHAIYPDSVGYVQRIDLSKLQSCTIKIDGQIKVEVLPGAFITPTRPLAYVSGESQSDEDFDEREVVEAFLIGESRMFDNDPRYGLVVMSQIADRALSPAVNDYGTAIDIIGILVRLFVMWAAPGEEESDSEAEYDRVEVPELSVRDMFDDAFTAIARDGSGAVEVATRIQQSLSSLALIGDSSMREAAIHHARRALAYAEKRLDNPQDLELVRELADFARKENNS